ncbi:MAG: TonB-dependent vitamin B12 receptor [Pseudoxanthomonas sp.]
MQYRIPAWSALALAVAMSLSAVAQADAPATDLDQIVVTGTRTAVAVEDSLAPAQVIDREQIDRSQAASLMDLLRGRAGVDIANQGGPGKLSSLFLRGTNAGHVLVLVDGVRIGAATNGAAAIQDLPLEQIERIEIVRGPRSSLYGSEAVGGVIQVFTRRGGEGLSRNLSLGVGSHGLRQAGGGFGVHGERGWFAVQGAHQRTDGINACQGTAGNAEYPYGAGCYADEPDKDGYRNTSVSLRGGYALTDALQVEAQALDADAYNEYDGSVFGGNQAWNKQQVFGGKLAWKPSERIALTAQVGRANDKSDNYFADAATDTRIATGRFDTRRDSAGVQGDFGFGQAQLFTVGGDWQNDEVTSTTAYDVDSRRNTGVFAEYQGRFGAHSLQASVRNDDNAQFGDHATGSLGYGLALGHGFKLTATAGTGFKAPTFNDLYYPGYSNPDLKPEKSKSADLGLAQYGDGWNWRLDVYETRIRDLIGYDSGYNLVNVDRARIRGAELAGQVSLAGWDIAAQASFTDPRNDTRDSYLHDNRLARRARDSGRIDVDRAFGALRAGVTVAGHGARYDDAANTQRLAGYGTLDLRLEYAISDEWTLQARAANVLDREYETVAWYNQPGREYGLTLRYNAR